MEHKWWHGKVAYQIYPKSFYDSNGDGIGDLQGIIQKLDYLKGLGVDILWLSPIYVSPLADQGYDISNYYEIDPRFGTMEDMDELLAAAKKRDMYILMDLVINHCSDEHEWFEKAMEDPDGKYGEFFYLAKQSEGRPSNWRSYFGGSVWESLPGTDRLYLHMFHKKQPDLNWENPSMREEVYRNINWWLDKGLAGFRLDAIINIKKPLPFRDYPADRDDGLCGPDVIMKKATGIGEFLGEMRDKTFALHDAFTVGEVFNVKDEDLADFIGENGYFSSMFDFEEASFGTSRKGWYDAAPITAEDYKNCCFTAQERISGIGFYSNIIENHDEPRGVSHYLPSGEHSEAAKKMLGGLNFMLRGLPFIYQGQELGMENTTFSSIDEVDDISSLDQYQVALDAGLTPEEALKVIAHFSRDNARTPMQWSDEAHAGFTSGTPWLKENANYKSINAKEQIGRETSVYHFYRQLIALRKDPEYQETVVYGELEPWKREQHNLMAYYRRSEKQALLVIGNFQAEPQDVVLPGGAYKVVLNNLTELSEEGKTLHLAGYQFLVLDIQG